MDSITLENYRCFREKQTARLAPLTLLVGENSTGKTSFLALIRALRDIAFENRLPNFKKEPYDLGSFDEIAHYRGGRGGRAETFNAGLEFRFPERSIPASRNRSHRKSSTFNYEVTFGREATAPFPIVRKLESEASWIREEVNSDRDCFLSFGTGNGSWRIDLREMKAFRGSVNLSRLVHLDYVLSLLRYRMFDRKEENSNIILEKINGSENPSEEDIEKLLRITMSISSYFPHEDENLYASAPVRSKPLRNYDPARIESDSEGTYIPMYLAGLYNRNLEEWTELKGALEKFGKEAGLFDEINVRLLSKKESDPFQVQIRKYGTKAKGPSHSLIDVGYGVSQVLPVITEVLRKDAPKNFLLQQPEVHLHPSAQAALGSLFCEMAGRGRQFFVETHSDHVLDRIRMDIRDGRTDLTHEDVSILYFERGNLDVTIHSIELDENGNIIGAPDGYRKFFMEETRRSLGLQ